MAKNNVDYIIIYDTREKDLSYVRGLEKLIDKRRKKDGSKMIGVECCTVKPNGVSRSTGDVTYKYRINDGEWVMSSFCLELKRGLDLFSSISTNAKFDRFMREFLRAVEANVDITLIYDMDVTKITEKIKSLEGNGYRKGKLRPNSDVLFLSKFDKLLTELGKINVKHYCSGTNMAYIIRRLVKNNLKTIKH